jgi:hypothetical protein
MNTPRIVELWIQAGPNPYEVLMDEGVYEEFLDLLESSSYISDVPLYRGLCLQGNELDLEYPYPTSWTEELSMASNFAPPECGGVVLKLDSRSPLRAIHTNEVDFFQSEDEHDHEHDRIRNVEYESEDEHDHENDRIRNVEYESEDEHDHENDRIRNVEYDDDEDEHDHENDRIRNVEYDDTNESEDEHDHENDRIRNVEYDDDEDEHDHENDRIRNVEYDDTNESEDEHDHENDRIRNVEYRGGLDYYGEGEVIIAPIKLRVIDSYQKDGIDIIEVAIEN